MAGRLPADRRTAWRLIVCAVIVPAVFPAHSLSQTLERESALERARVLAEKGQYDSAKAVLGSILARDPEDLGARVALARTLSWEGRFEEAGAGYDTVIARDPNNGEALFGKAQVSAWLGRSGEALVLLDRLRGQHPPSQAERLLRANVHFWSGSPERALPLYEEAHGLDSLDRDAIRGIARCYVQTDRLADAAGWYRRLLALDPSDAEARREQFRLSFLAKNEIHMVAEIEEFAETGVATSSMLDVDYYHEFARGFTPFLHLGYTNRFSQKDLRYGGGAYTGPWPGVNLFGRVIAAPKSSVLPRLDLIAESWFMNLKALELLAGLRALWFESKQVMVISVGTRVDGGSSWRFFPRLYLSRATDESSSLSASVLIDKALSQRTLLQFGGHVGSESFRASSIGQVSNRTSVGGYVGVRSRISATMGLDGSFQYVARKDVSDSALLTAGVLIFIH